MGHRLTKIYTRTGDNGETGLAGGERVSKNSPLVQAMGDVDELNSLLGLLVCQLQGEIVEDLMTVQNDLFDLGAELNMSSPYIGQQHVEWLEERLDLMNEGLPPLKEFILPGGGETASMCHLARSVCRRAERSLVQLAGQQAIASELLAYINRLSDMLFVMARYITRQEGEKEIYWRSDRMRKGI